MKAHGLFLIQSSGVSSIKFNLWILICNSLVSEPSILGFDGSDETPSDAKVRFAAVHMEGKALYWHQAFMKSRLTREIPNLKEYVRALSDRFEVMLYEDPMAELMNLKQIGSIKEYLDKFDELLNNVDLSENYAISCFLAGLKSEIAIQVALRGRKPSTVKVIGPAKMQKVLNKPAQLSMMQEHHLSKEFYPAPLVALLDEFEQLFIEPTALPPQRSHDHKIILKEGSSPVSVRPYRYPSLQKDEIEKLVQAMLDAEEDSTWEDLYNIQHQFPSFQHFVLEDKDFSKGEGLLCAKVKT
ncbi:hypothetical protein BUALT_Bualt05G0123000 [Buddleja alternifolia]|uniref:Retrotransposon gag domain-containing protein n=1 Tax=Buddleja alternifolia TaxID=168488 RepID=A0AAV6XKK3_9LAMI|nr:hypothetical protein BUALT_Bualt05G0123000 [Buddleja alternifolia]